MVNIWDEDYSVNPKYKLTPEQRECLVERYVNGEKTPDLAREFGVSLTNVRNLVRKRGFDFRGQVEAQRKHSCDDHFFDQIDREDKAYWLGFFFADGNISNRGEVRLGLSARDLSHMEKFRSAIVSGHKIYQFDLPDGPFGTGLSGCQISIRRKEMAEAITDKRKLAEEARWGEFLPSEVMRHFWRGVVDGDGHISQARPEKPHGRERWRVLLTSQDYLCEGLLSFVQGFAETKTRVRPHKSIFNVEFFGAWLAVRVAQELYGDATIYLDRKYAVWKEMCDCGIAPCSLTPSRRRHKEQ